MKITGGKALFLPNSEIERLTNWGGQSLKLEFAGIRFVIDGLNAEQYRILKARYAAASEQSGSVLTAQDSIRTILYRLPSLEQDPDRYTTGGIYTPLISRIEDGIEIEGHGFLATVVLEPRFSGTLRAADGHLLVLPIVIENYLRIIAAYATLLRGGLLLHSAGVVADGRAYLFLGRSGAGKTTISRLALAAGCSVLSDDINIVLPSPAGGFGAGAIPFAGELGYSCLVQNGSYPLAGIYWLEKSQTTFIESLCLAVQMAKLYACSPVVNAETSLMERILAASATLLAAKPMQTLFFNRDESFLAILKEIRGNDDAKQ